MNATGENACGFHSVPTYFEIMYAAMNRDQVRASP